MARKKALNQDVIKMYKHGRDYQADFLTIQGKLRGFAFILFLTGFGALGVLIANKNLCIETTPLGFLASLCGAGAIAMSKNTFITLVCFLTQIGFYIIWILDQRVYQKLIRGIFYEGSRFEDKFESLPQFHNNMMLASDNKGMGVVVRFYYFIPMVLLFLFALLYADSIFNFLILILMVLIAWDCYATKKNIDLLKKRYKEDKENKYSLTCS